MQCDVRTGLTKAVVTGPGRQLLFCGRCSMSGRDEADATFLLTGAGTWVGKLAYLATKPMTIQVGQWAIAQAVTDCWVKARGPGHPHLNLLPNNPSGLTIREVPLQRMPLGMVAPTVNHHHIGAQGAESTIDVGEIKGLCHLGSHHLPQTKGSRVTGAHYQQLPQCHPGLIDKMVSWHFWQGRWHWEDRAHMKINFHVFKDEDAKDTVTYQSWRWDLTVYWCVGCRDCTLLPYAN